MNDRNEFGSVVEPFWSPTEDTTPNAQLLREGTAEETADEHSGSQTDTVAVENTPIDDQSVTELADTAVLIQQTGDGVRGEKALRKRRATEYRPADSFVEGSIRGRGIGDSQLELHSNDKNGGMNAETAMPHNGASSDTVERSQQLSNLLIRS